MYMSESSLTYAQEQLASLKKEVKSLRELVVIMAIPLEALHMTECDDRAIALSKEMKAAIRAVITQLHNTTFSFRELEAKPT